MSEALELDADLVSRDDVIRLAGERRRYRVTGIRTTVLIPTRGQDIPADDRRRITLDLRPVSRGASARTVTLRPTDRLVVV